LRGEAAACAAAGSPRPRAWWSGRRSAAAPRPPRPRSGQRGGTDGDERRAPGGRRSSPQNQRGSQTEVHLLVLRLAGIEITQLVLQVVAQTVAVVPLEGPQTLDRLVEVGQIGRAHV